MESRFMVEQCLMKQYKLTEAEREWTEVLDIQEKKPAPDSFPH